MKIPGKTFIPNWWVLALSLSECGRYSTCAPNGIIGPLNNSPNLRSYGVFPSARRSWTFRRWQQHSMESDHDCSSNPDCNNTADVPSFTLRATSSEISLVSKRWGVEVRWFHDKPLQDLPNSNELSVSMTFGFCDGSRNFRGLFSVFCEVFFLHGLDCIHCGEILYHDSVSVFAPGFTSLAEDFVIRCYQITKLYITFSARNPRNFVLKYTSRFRSVGKWV